MSALKAKDPKLAPPSKPKVLIFGAAGVGKTWWALDFPSVYYIDTEGGADLAHYTDKLKKSGGMYLGPDEGSQDFDVITGQFKALATEKHKFKTVVVDSITKPWQLAITAEGERLGSANAFGADKKAPIAAMRRLVSWVTRLDMNVVFIAHEKQEWGKDDKGERTQIGSTFDAWDKLEYELHLCIQVQKRGPKRIGFIRKSRLLEFPQGENFAWTFDEFADRYGRTVIAADVQQGTLASAEQIAEAKRLIEVVRVTPEEIEKWLVKANAATWADLDAEHCEKIIKFLKGKVA